MNSVSMKLGETLGMVKAVGTLEKSTELMTMVNDLVKVKTPQSSLQNPSLPPVSNDISREVVTRRM